ncbi:patatin-like phospholipase family protein [Spirochaeta dissipatitropha]
MKNNTLLSIFLALMCLLGPSESLWARDSDQDSRPTVALVLEGGGALGFAHIGVIKIIEELGIPIDLVVGTSMGATVGGFYAMGYDSSRLEEITLSINWDDVFAEQIANIDERYLDRIDQSSYFASLDFDLSGFQVPGSLLTGRKMLYYLDRLTLDAAFPTDFDRMPRRFRAVTTDMATGERVVIGQGSLSDAMRASMGIPGVLAPFIIDGRYLIDGFVVDNLAVDVARDLGADLIIAVHLSRDIPFDPESLNRNPLETLTRAVDIMVLSNVQRQLSDADLIVKVDVSRYETTDYKNAVEIIALGKNRANEMRMEFALLKSKLGSLSDYSADLRQDDQTPISRIDITGGSRNDRDSVRILFAPFVGNTLVPEELEKAIATLEASGSYEYIRLQRTNEENGPVLTVRLQKRKAPGHSLRLGFDYESTYSGSSLSSAGLSFSMVFRSLLTEHSRLMVNAGILDSPAVELILLQPIGTDLFIEGFAMARQSTEAYFNNTSGIFLQQTGTVELGVNLGASPVTWLEITTGIRYQWVKAALDPIIPSGEAQNTALIGSILLSTYRLDSPVLPTVGYSVQARYDQSFVQSGSAAVFRVLNIEGFILPDLSIPFSFALWAKAGSDFSAQADAAGAAPLYHKPRLSDRQFFPGPLEVQERIGSHIAGIGIELKYQLNDAFRATDFPTFVLLHASQGTVLPDYDDLYKFTDFSHWTTTIGLGTRFNDGFGALFRLGGTYRLDDRFRMFLALDLGSIGNRKKNR